jgi:hypothetical protein
LSVAKGQPPYTGGGSGNQTPTPGYTRSRKTVDFGNGNSFDVEDQVNSLAFPVVLNKNGTISLLGGATVIVDPSMATTTPLKGLTIAPGNTALPAGYVGKSNFAAVVRGLVGSEGGGQFTAGLAGEGVLYSYSHFAYRNTSNSNASQVITADLRNMAKTLNIVMTGSAGTFTLTVESSVDNTAFFTIDSIAAAASQTKIYTETTVGATTAVSPLGFRYCRITAGTAGVGNTTTMTIGAK